ncbi:AraC family transcriptional regulator, arabinose operon regulatory protein [Paenibacillus sp. UNC496MF]|uniref:AraC family transcriptional regulator n=1 Tax=Paenibacillus sp. UNC496MF TaxID=1502753 RepID=UPI0008EA3E38|nr:AraC family transcriptional regulator [Paenibacillus sp. UNC496MF]SFJ04617.1 AraC family transcriptional regulator, arabinose operon regulatory protein [Paenibacillus sp. UNC496MF]
MKVESFHMPSIVSDLDLYYCGVEEVERFFTCGPHIRDRYLIHYVIGGSGFFDCHGRRYQVGAGEIFAIFPGELTYYETDPDDPWTFCWFAFGGRRSKEMLQRAGISHDVPVRRVHGGDAIRGYVELLNETLHAYPSRDLPAARIHGALYDIFAVLELSYLASRPAMPAKADAADYVGKALQFVETHYQSPISIKNIADYVGLERTYFTKQFTKATGESPQQYLIKYRIDQAQRLLSTTAMTVGQVGKSVGIPELAYFSRLFKKVVGVAPKQHGLRLQAERRGAGR